MRGTVLLTELLYHLVIYYTAREQWHLHFLFGIFLVDNVHFQYNAMMYAILILAAAMAQRSHYSGSAMLLGLLLGLKHLFLTVAPAFAVFYIF